MQLFPRIPREHNGERGTLSVQQATPAWRNGVNADAVAEALRKRQEIVSEM